MAATAAIIVLVAVYGVARPPAPAAPGGLLRQVANGQRVSAASQAARVVLAATRAALSAGPPSSC